MNCLWSIKHQSPYAFLKDCLAWLPLFSYPDLIQPLTLYTDALNVVFDTCPVQTASNLDSVWEEKPLHFLLQKAVWTHTKWSPFKREPCAVYYATQNLKYFLAYRWFAVKKDHRPLEDAFLSKQEMLNIKVQKSFNNIHTLDIKLDFQSGSRNFSLELFDRVVPNASSTSAKEEYTFSDERHFGCKFDQHS